MIVQKLRRLIYGNRFVDPLHGVEVINKDTITTDLKVEFDPDVFGKPDYYNTGVSILTYDQYEISFEARRISARDENEFFIGPRKYTPNTPDEYFELAKEAVEQWMEETPRDEWPHSMTEYDEDPMVEI